MACFGYSTSTHNNAKLTLKGTCTVLEKILEDAKSYDATSNIEIEKQIKNITVKKKQLYFFGYKLY